MLAQAWLPPAGTGSVTIAYQNTFSGSHLDSKGRRDTLCLPGLLPDCIPFEQGHSYSHQAILYTEYGLTDKLALDFSLPYIEGRYRGDFPHTNGHNQDDGSYHGAFQDFRFGLRYNIRRHPLLITPFAEAIVPSHKYEDFAHSNIGKRLGGVQLGVNLGRLLEPLVPRTYVHAQLSYTAVERVAGIRPNRSRLDAEVGHFLTRRLAVSFLQNLQVTHSGLDFPEDYLQISDAAFLQHDRTLQDSFLNLGAGFTFALSESWDVFGSYVRIVWGHNAHALDRGIVIGISRTFSTRAAAPQPFRRTSRSASLPLWRFAGPRRSLSR